MASLNWKKNWRNRRGRPLMEELPSAESQKSSQNGSYMKEMGIFPRLADIDWSYVIWFVKVLTIMIPIAVALAVPVIIYRNDQEVLEDETFEAKQYRQLVFYLFKWLLATWVGGCVSFLVGTGFPYLFRFIWRYVNPAQAKYWRIFRFLRRPITCLGMVIVSYVTFDMFINGNENLAVTTTVDPEVWRWDDTIDDILMSGTLWAALYFVEKIVLLYITVHYHYRSDLVRIEHSKDIHEALVSLYRISSYHIAPSTFLEEDRELIRNATGAEHNPSRMRVTSYLARLGIDTYAMTSLFGNFLGEADSHWFKPASAYATVERALANPTSAAALARCLWKSFTLQDAQTMTAHDILEVQSPEYMERWAEREALAPKAKAIFKVLDENENGDISLDEMVYTVVEAGRVRHNIYKHMSQADHCLNTFDWIMLLFIATVMVLFILVSYVPAIKDIKDTAGFVAIGLSFAVGRTVHFFLTGVVFVFFNHPFDIGDRVDVYNITATASQPLVVIKQSLLYTVFRRVETGTLIQISNERLMQKRIENITRSGNNRQGVTLTVDFGTSFQDLEALRHELEDFLGAHPHDYEPKLAMGITTLHELNKIELRFAFNHKSNWSNEPLRAARSMRFMCALVAAVRKFAITTPARGGEARPTYTVMLSDREMVDKVAKKAAAEAKAADIALDVSGLQNSEQDPAAMRREVEKTAMNAISKLPAGRAGRPSRGTSTGVDLGNEASGLRTNHNMNRDPA